MPVTSWASPLFWGPLLVSAMALWGVVLSSRRTARSLIAAENLRAEKALVAEGVRHQNALNHAEATRLSATKSEAYFKILEIVDAQILETRTLLDKMKPKRSGAKIVQMDDVEFNRITGGLNKSLVELGSVMAVVRSVGNADISVTAAAVRITIQKTIQDANKRRFAFPEVAYVPEELDRAFTVKTHSLYRGMIAQVRQELIGDANKSDIAEANRLLVEEFGNPVPEQSAKDDSPAADLPKPSLDAANA